ncbi:MAG: hypothetical protein ACRDOH_07785 [Streptosporangiaceae bacterium]
MTAEGSVSPRLVAALDRAWAAVRARHPDVPEVVIALGAGSAGNAPGTLTLGHFAGDRWQRGDGGSLPEMFVAGEGLGRGARAVLGTVLHEAAHGLASTRGIRDTSRQGRYHNTRYRRLAEELGLAVAQVDGIGWSGTTVTDAAAAVYAAEIGDLAGALVAWRHPERRGGGRAGGSNNGLAARCGCGRRIRVAPAVYDAGPITCGICGGDFTA